MNSTLNKLLTKTIILLLFVFSLSIELSAQVTPVMDSLKVDTLSIKTANDTIQNNPEEEVMKDYTTIFDQFYGVEVQKFRLETDFTTLIKKKALGEEQDAELVWLKEDQSTVTFPVEVEARGKSRRKICAFPPIKIKFKQKDLEQRGFAKAFKTLKLVTHCLESEKGERNILKEYLVYKMYNELTEHSFRVQLVHIEYIDKGKKKKKRSRYGFLIEDKDELAYRHQGKISNTYSYDCKKLDAKKYCEMLAFQYMIGNQDWRVRFLHNVKLIKPFDGSAYIPVPYDFDYSGFVNTNYAVPNPDLGTETTQQRIFMGDVTDIREEMNEVLQSLRDKKEVFYEFIDNQLDIVEKRDKKEMKRYLDSFYRLIKTDKAAISNMRPISW